jgi:hypothetical protein
MDHVGTFLGKSPVLLVKRSVTFGKSRFWQWRLEHSDFVGKEITVTSGNVRRFVEAYTYLAVQILHCQPGISAL